MTYQPNPHKRLTRSLTQRWIAGVCGGIAERFNLDPTIVRLGFVALSLTGFFPGIIAYIIAWVIMPEGL
ncbi:PspC domain-containing protein [Corynebacterium mayonis]|uniref:PspC domain-containing protein n=1 Tax=Corynebacterium mayonis TaxID=3062461 RepID=UPI0031405682